MERGRAQPISGELSYDSENIRENGLELTFSFFIKRNVDIMKKRKIYNELIINILTS